ncbi:hypothetical protein LWI28_027719 [Acer negundo]|uniref:Uncharacterized protein n=1 Tax=Acer negundo TaxID=4023 RepID=A0AAD5P3E3_ACENE|nr:hypothetical protein LWI28_027719 [Acer negundo]
MKQFQQNPATTVHHAPSPIKLNHRPISFTTSVLSKQLATKSNFGPVAPDDCHIDCDSSTVDDGDDCVLFSSSRKICPLDLNLPPLMTMDGVDDDDGDDFRATALCL